MKVRLSIHGGEESIDGDYDLSEPIWLGRDPDCAVSLPGQSVSRRHLEMASSAEGIRLTDSSTNGTVVEGLLLKKASRYCTLKEFVVVLGNYRVQVTQLAPERVTTAPQLTDGNEDSRARTNEFSGPSVDVRRQIHARLLENLDLASLGPKNVDPVQMHPRVVQGLRRILAEFSARPEWNLPPENSTEDLVQELADEALGLGPLEKLLRDDDVSEIMVVDPHTIFVERRGKLELSPLRFTDDQAVRAVIERIVTPLGRRIDESTPLVDARLRDGSRVNAVIPPLALRGSCITIRKFSKEPLRMADLVGFGSLSPRMARFLEMAVAVKRNIVISGGTGSGKTTLLNVLSGAIPARERVITVEDAAELQLIQPHVVSLEARPPNLEGKGEYSIRDLVKNALRMRPDRIVVGECRGGEALDMLQAMNTGHEGSLTTTHANSAKEAIARIETLCLMAGLELPIRAIRQQIASSIHLILQQTRFSDGSRRVQSIAEVTGINEHGEIELQEIYTFRPDRSEFVATGYLPTFVDRLLQAGLVEGGSVL